MSHSTDASSSKIASSPAHHGAATLSAQVYEQLRDDIVSCELAPGSRLTLDMLGERYHVGMTPLREALYRLSASQLILGEDRRGFRVTPATVAHHDDILITRLHVEPLVLRGAFEAGDIAWEAQILGALHRLRSTPMYEADSRTIRPQWEMAHREFHLSVLSGAPLKTLLAFQHVLWDHAARYRNLVHVSQLDPAVLQDEHDQICEAVLVRDVDMACLLLKRHIEKAGESVREGLRQQEIGDHESAD